MRIDLFFPDNYPWCKYESEINLSDTIVDGGDGLDITGRDFQDYADTLETRCENLIAPNPTPKKKSNPVKEHFCPQCSKSYSHSSSLNRHLKYECGKACKFGCPYCEAESKQREVCRRHIIRRHKGRAIYINELY